MDFTLLPSVRQLVATWPTAPRSYAIWQQAIPALIKATEPGLPLLRFVSGPADLACQVHCPVISYQAFLPLDITNVTDSLCV